MSRTGDFFESAKRFQDKRKEIMDTFERRVRDLERHQGSQYYTEEMAKAEQTKTDALKSLKAEYTSVLSQHIDGMDDANEARAMAVPTEEELRLMTALKMRTKVSKSELRRAANTLKNSEIGLAIVQEVADKQLEGQVDSWGYPKVAENYMKYSASKEMPVHQVNEALKFLAESVKDFIEHDTVKMARVALEHHENLYGKTGDERPLPKRPLFTSKQSCFKELVGLSGEELTRFCAAVDSEA